MAEPYRNELWEAQWKYYEPVDYNSLEDSFFSRNEIEPRKNLEDPDDNCGVDHECVSEPEILYDRIKGNYICKSCGLVLNPYLIFQAGTFQTQEKKDKVSGWNTDFISSMEDEISIPKYVREYASKIFEFAQDKNMSKNNMLRKLEVDNIAKASLWLSIRVHSVPVFRGEFCHHAQIGNRRLVKTGSIIYRELVKAGFKFGGKRLRLTASNPLIYLSKVCSNLGVENYEPAARSYLNKYNELKTQKGLPDEISFIFTKSVENTAGYAGAAVYLACRPAHELYQEDVAQGVWTTTVTLRERIKELFKISNYYKKLT